MKQALIIILILAVMMMRGTYFPPEAGKHSAEPMPTPVASAETGELLAYTATREDAEQIAALYGIELTRWESGLAVFSTTRDTAEVISEGIANGWPALSPNRVDQPF